MSWGTQAWGLGMWGGGQAPLAGYAYPFLVGSSPANGAVGVAVNAPIAFEIAGEAGLDTFSLNVQVEGQYAIHHGVFQAGFTGTITTTNFSTYNVTGGTIVASGFIIEINTHPNFVGPHVDVITDVTDLAGHSATLTFGFDLNATAVQFSSTLVAKTFCEGKRIDLFWTNPGGVAQVRIRRSSIGYCRFVTDPGEDIYLGSPITTFVDGLYTGSSPTSNKALDEDKFYYYTIFLSYTSSPTAWTWSPQGQVQGLSIKDYFAQDGDYVYNLLPKRVRQRDSDPENTDRYFTRDLCRLIQCGINLYRGWNEGLLHIKDGDLAPSGRNGEADNQFGILAAHSWDLGIPPERSFDAGVLRRIALGIIPVYKEKGTCPGLVDFMKLFTGWDGRCDEAIEPLCGVNRLALTWDGSSYIQTGSGVATTPSHTVGGAPITIAAGSLTISPSDVFDALGTTAAVLPTTPPLLAFIIDAMGTYACVASYASNVVTMDDVTALLRSEIQFTGTYSASTVTIGPSGINTVSYPWQYPSSGGNAQPTFGQNAWAGYKVMDSTGQIRNVTASAATDGSGNTILTVDGALTTGSMSLAKDFDVSGATFATRKPIFKCKFYIGEFSLVYDPKWDIRLKDEGLKGPWSLITAVGAINTLGYAPTPADVTLWAKSVHSALGKSTGVASNTMADSTASWTTNQWAGYYVNPNWNQSKLYRIVGNSTNSLTVDIGDGGGVNTVSITGSHYVILTEENALKYSRLVKLLPSFLPHESRGFVKFEV